MNINIIKKACIENKIIGSKIVFFEQVTSTNDIAKEFLEKGCDEGLVIISENQTFGRGTQGRKWSSEPGVSILMSIVFYPDKKIKNMQKIVDIGTEAVYKCLGSAVSKSQGVDLRIKKPNDVYLNNKKIAGVLVESSTKGKNIEYAVLGIGININNKSFSHELNDIASSLYIETQIEYNREDIIICLLETLDKFYGKKIS